jgi:hypothetical protein
VRIAHLADLHLGFRQYHRLQVVAAIGEDGAVELDPPPGRGVARVARVALRDRRRAEAQGRLAHLDAVHVDSHPVHALPVEGPAARLDDAVGDVGRLERRDVAEALLVADPVVAQEGDRDAVHPGHRGRHVAGADGQPVAALGVAEVDQGADVHDEAKAGEGRVGQRRVGALDVEAAQAVALGRAPVLAGGAEEAVDLAVGEDRAVDQELHVAHARVRLLDAGVQDPAEDRGQAAGRGRQVAGPVELGVPPRELDLAEGIEERRGVEELDVLGVEETTLTGLRGHPSLDLVQAVQEVGAVEGEAEARAVGVGEARVQPGHARPVAAVERPTHRHAVDEDVDRPHAVVVQGPAGETDRAGARVAAAGLAVEEAEGRSRLGDARRQEQTDGKGQNRSLSHHHVLHAIRRSFRRVVGRGRVPVTS